MLRRTTLLSKLIKAKICVALVFWFDIWRPSSVGLFLHPRFYIPQLISLFSYLAALDIIRLRVKVLISSLRGISLCYKDLHEYSRPFI